MPESRNPAPAAAPAQSLLSTLAACVAGLAAGCVLGLLLLLPGRAHAVALGTWATDASVCDFGNGAPYLIQRKLMPAGNVQQYIDATVGWISTHCANGQQLRMGDTLGHDASRRILTEVANRVCRIADVKWEPLVTPTGGPTTMQGFAVRCPIAKLGAAEKTDGK